MLSEGLDQRLDDPVPVVSRGVTDVRRILRIQARHNLVEHAVFQSVQLVPSNGLLKIFLVHGHRRHWRSEQVPQIRRLHVPLLPSQVHQGYSERPTQGPQLVKADIAPTRFNGSNSGRSPLLEVPEMLNIRGQEFLSESEFHSPLPDPCPEKGVDPSCALPCWPVHKSRVTFHMLSLDIL